MDRLPLALLVLSGACASTTATVPPAEPAPSLQARMEADPTWRPGDTEPTPVEVATWEPYVCPPDAETCAMEMGVELRNRCGEPARFVVGPPVDGAAPEDAPVNELAPGQAIFVWVPGHYEFSVADRDGAFSLHAPVSRSLVFMGDGACESLHVDRGGGGGDQVISTN